MSKFMYGPSPPPASATAEREWARELAPLGAGKLKVIMDISNKCNLRCRMCHFALDEVFYRPAVYMTPSAFEQMAKQILPNAHTLILSARNEPLTSPWFKDILSIAANYHVPNLLFITNATRMNASISEAIVRSGVTEVQISVDGPTKVTYEEIRRGGNFDTVVKNIKTLAEAKARLGSSTPNIQFNIVLMKSNIETLPLFIDLAEDVGVTTIAARHVLLTTGLNLEDESLYNIPEKANEYFKLFLDRVDASTSVKVIGFPDLFEVTRMQPLIRKERIFSAEHPFGFLDQPSSLEAAPNGTVTLSGWALDRPALTGVTIEREPLSDEAHVPLNDRGLIGIAEARLGLERQDVAQIYPDFANSIKAGWSVEISNRHLFHPTATEARFHIFAFGLDGRQVELGERYIRFGN